ncbi:MAG: hypothetical protein K8L97_34340 [Anaerolineae bacterium]|nr:hypothetical protein [Anaerolineae bacterium]
MALGLNVADAVIAMVRFYERQSGIQWQWQSISKACPAPLGGSETGKSPADRTKRGSKIHMLVEHLLASAWSECEAYHEK